MANSLDDGPNVRNPYVLETQSTSDQVVDLWCEPCYFESDKHIEAVSYCSTCNSILCKSCDNAHSRLPSTKQHEVSRGPDLPKSNVDKPIKYFDCISHPGNKSDHFCLTHGHQMCCKCVKKHHKQCVVKDITNLCNELSSDDITNIKKDLLSVHDKINDFKVSLGKNISDIRDRQDTLVSELNELHGKIMSKVDQLFTEMNDNIKQKCDNVCSDLSDKLSLLSDTSDSLDQILVDIQRTATCNCHENSFIRMQEIVEKANTLTRTIEGSNIQRETIQLAFSPNQDIVSFLSSPSLYGEIRVAQLQKPPLHLPLVTFPRPQINIAQIKVKKMRSVNVKTLHDEDVCNIVGMAEHCGGTILLADNMNRNIKMFSSDHEMLSSLTFPACPNDVTVPNNSTTFVPANGRNVHCLQISKQGTLKLEGTLSLEYEVLACSAYKDEFLITTNTNPSTLKMIDRNGAEKWSLSTDTLGRNLFKLPCFIVCKMFRGKPIAVVSDSAKETLTLVDSEYGGLIRTINVRNGKPAGMSVDSYGNLYVCYRGTKEIAVWSADVEKSRIILSGWDLKPDIYCVLYNKTTDKLFASYCGSDSLDVFKVIH